MATTFDVFYLGTELEIDQSEGDANSEHAAALVGNTYGGVGDPLVNHRQTMAPTGDGFSLGVTDSYDVDNNTENETFSIDGGAAQTMDGVAVYNATITYIDGTTATISAVLFQDTAGNLYLAPELVAGADQTALEAEPIRSLTLDSLITSNTILNAHRVQGSYAVCFTSGTAIRTARGEVLIDDLRVGDFVFTMDNGPQPIRWIGKKHLGMKDLLARLQLRPILISKHVMGARRDLLVSPQHGMLLKDDHLVRAKHLVSAPQSRVRIARGKRFVTYIHLMFDAHQIIFSEGVPSESFFPGPMAQRMVDSMARQELKMLYPDVFENQASARSVRCSYGETVRDFVTQKSIGAHATLCENLKS